MKKQKALILVIMFTLLTTIFAMSDDGRKEPQIEKKEIKQEVVSEKAEIEIEKAKSNKTVKDRFDIDTGKSNDKLESFKQDYAIKFKKLFSNFKESSSEWFFDSKINLNKKMKLEELGINFENCKNIATITYKENVLLNEIIVIGKVIELIQDGNNVPKYKFQIEKIINGSELIEKFLGEIPEFLYFIAFIYTSRDNELILDRKGIYYFYLDPNKKRRLPIS
jgi:hypothetical protein